MDPPGYSSSLPCGKGCPEFRLKKLLSISYFPCSNPPESVGEERVFHLTRGLSRHFDTTLLSLAAPTAEESDWRHGDSLRELRFPKSPFFQRCHDWLDSLAGFDNCSGLVCSMAAWRQKRFREELERQVAEADIVSLEGPYLHNLLPRRRKKRQFLVYSAQMVEAQAAKALFGRGVRGRMARARVASIERAAACRADMVLATCYEDAGLLHKLHGIEFSRIEIVPGGVNTQAIPPCPNEEVRNFCRTMFKLPLDRRVVIFNGDASYPNEMAVDAIVHSLAVELPHVIFLVVGHIGARYESQELPPNVKLTGWVDFDRKKRLLYCADAAVLPMVHERQNWQETIEYMSAGLPVVSTPEGVEALDLEHRRNAMILPPDGLARGLEEVLQEGLLRRLLGAEARRTVMERHSWEKITEDLAQAYDLKTSPRVLILNDYPVTPAEQGGQVRIESVARNLAAKGICSTILTLKTTGREERRQVDPRIEEINVPRGALHKLADAILKDRLKCGADDVTALLLTRWLSRGYARVLRRESRFADAMMLSHPYMQPTSDVVASRMSRLYYDSHNTEFSLKNAIYPATFLARQLASSVRRAEIRSASRSVATFCVSETNRHELGEMVPGLDKRSFVCPNGVDVDAAWFLPTDERRRRRRQLGINREFMAIFVGSGHPPNAEAARFIVNKLSRIHSRVMFVLVGTVNGWFHKQPLPSNVLFTGPVSTPVKNALLSLADFALNPMLTGSGTSLKMMDYMAAGLPILSTAVGARGLDETELKSIVLLEAEELSEGLRTLLSDPVRMAALSQAARLLAERRYDWRITLRQMIDFIAKDLGIPENGHVPAMAGARE